MNISFNLNVDEDLAHATNIVNQLFEKDAYHNDVGLYNANH